MDTILHEAVCLGDVAMVQDLLALGSNVNEPDGLGYTPLDYAIDGEEDLEMVETLLKAGASVTGGAFGTPLHRAVYLGQISTIQLLLQYGAEANAEDMDGHTPLAHLFAHGRYSQEAADKTPRIEQMLRASVDRKGRSRIAKSQAPKIPER